MADTVKIDGLAQFLRNLKKLDANLPKTLRLAFNDAANIVIVHAKTKVPRRTGAAAASIKAASTRSMVRVSAGGRKAPYYPWLDFGGKVGRHDSVKRPFFTDGRYLYPSLHEKRDQVYEAVVKALLNAVEAAGIEVG